MQISHAVFRLLLQKIFFSILRVFEVSFLCPFKSGLHVPPVGSWRTQCFLLSKLMPQVVIASLPSLLVVSETFVGREIHFSFVVSMVADSAKHTEGWQWICEGTGGVRKPCSHCCHHCLCTWTLSRFKGSSISDMSLDCQLVKLKKPPN